MTTIAASLEMGIMAADSRGTLHCSKTGPMYSFACTKLSRVDGWIIGCAGDQVDLDSFMAWLSNRRKPRRKVKDSFAALMLSRHKLLYVFDDSLPEAVRVPYMAIGTGGGFALAAMNAMVRVGADPDPRIAVEVTAEYDSYTGGPVDFLTWRKSPDEQGSET